MAFDIRVLLLWEVICSVVHRSIYQHLQTDQERKGQGHGDEACAMMSRSIISVGYWRRRDRAGEPSRGGVLQKYRIPVPRQPSKPFNADTDSSTSPALQCSQRRLLRKMSSHYPSPPLDLHHLFHQLIHACLYQPIQILPADAVPSPQPGAEPLQSPCSSLLIPLRHRYSQCVCTYSMYVHQRG